MSLALPYIHAKDGADSSGGGEGIICFDNASIPEEIRKNGGELLDKYVDKDGNDHITMIKSADLYEAEEKAGWDSPSLPEIIDVESPNESPLSYTERIAKRFEHYVPYVADMIRAGNRAFPRKAVRHKEHGLKKIDDARNFGLLDDKCVAVQLAVQVNLSGDYSDLYLDSRLYWHPKHSALSRGVLALHEFVYRKARQLGQTDSHNTRKLVGYLIKKNLDHSVPVLIGHLESLGFTKPGEPALSYRGELVRKVATRLFMYARSSFLMHMSMTIAPLIAKANTALEPLHKTCEPGSTLHALYACQDLVASVEGLNSLKEELQYFIDHAASFIKTSLELSYADDGGVGTYKWLSEQPGMSPEFLAQVDQLAKQVVIEQSVSIVYRLPPNLIPIEDMTYGELGYSSALRSEKLDPSQGNVIIP
jgi:hypothetical protein